MLQANKNIKQKIGVFLETQPYGGGSFQYAQSILFALDTLSKADFEIIAFYIDDLWDEYLNQFDFLKKKIYSRRALCDYPGALLIKLAMLFGRNIARLRNFCAGISKFSRQFDDLQLDVIIFPSQGIDSATIKTKSITVIHDLMHRYERYPELSSKKEFNRRECIFSSVCDSASLIFVDSELGKEHVLESYGQKYDSKITVMPFTPPHYLFESCEDRLPGEVVLPEKFIFYPAQFWEHKNHKNLIMAAKMLKEKGIEIQLIFVGSQKNGYEEAIELIHVNGVEDNIHVFGYVSDSLMRILYRRARAMIMASFCGPTNIPPLEGMAMGCPVAVSNKYAMPWQVGEAGLTFDPENVEEIANVIEKMWIDDNLCEKLSYRGRERAKFFGQDAFNKRFTKAILQALA